MIPTIPIQTTNPNCFNCRNYYYSCGSAGFDALGSFQATRPLCSPNSPVASFVRELHGLSHFQGLLSAGRRLCEWMYSSTPSKFLCSLERLAEEEHRWSVHPSPQLHF